MDGERWRLLKDAFASLSELPPPERLERLAALSERDPDLAARVQALLDADARADSLLHRFDLMPQLSRAIDGREDASDAGRTSVTSSASDPFGYAGHMVADYKVLDVLGAGGMGIVYRAEDTRLERRVALKFLLPQYSLDPDAKQRFLREARAASTLDHPNVCTVYGVGETERGDLFLAMACYEGETLKARIARSPIDIADVTHISRQILAGLGAAHDAGIVHRDLKPGNIMLAGDGTVKILDFGLAKVADVAVTGSGLRPGTVAYMSPEQVEGTPVDHRSDLWSFGVVMYEMLTGRRPFSGNDLSAVYSILHDEPIAPSRVRANVPQALDALVERLLRKRREERFQSSADVAAALEATATDPSARVPSPSATSARRWTRPIVVAGVLGTVALGGTLALVPEWRGAVASSLGGMTAVPARQAGIDQAVDPRSVAVLPFVDMSPQGDQTYFSDGITEEILNALAQLPELRVPARTSSFSFKRSNLPMRDIARQLGVASVLEGSVRKDGDIVRITAQLIDARSDRHLWSRTFDRKLDDIFAVQSEIAHTVAEALKVRLGDKGNLVTAPRAPDARAHDLYLQGRFHWNRRSGDDLRRAIQYFEDATRADSTYARAYAGLALAYAVLPLSDAGLPVIPPLRKAEEAAAKAIALDPAEAEAYAALGYAYNWEWRWTDAEQALRRATELDPSNATARQWYGEHLVQMGRAREAEAELRRAVMLDPLSPVANVNLGLVLLLGGQVHEAIAQLEQTSRMDPSFWIPLLLLHRAYLLVGRAEESATAGRRFAELTGTGKPEDLVTLARGVGSPNARGAALAVLEDWKSARRPQWPVIAMYYALLGEHDQAIDALEHGLEARAPMMMGTKVAPWLVPLHGEPRFERILRRMNYP